MAIDGDVKMEKDGQQADVEPGSVAEMERQGWKRVEAPAPAGEPQGGDGGGGEGDQGARRSSRK